ncbi:holo-ACP synthase [Collinsella sp. zg1085]|uniref:holo-ACP synthase n=1 Tax=Collinsella sp. zg1085 TaxID=2844380 RepID=UPI001C0B839C|nr:holo-ACP synthase [Collinsella sp. zg1085]QWT17177.1 holo-ACP synthase [Collinsella sp. zg1085]
MGVADMILGIGIDSVSISDIDKYWSRFEAQDLERGLDALKLDPFLSRTFSARELSDACARGRRGSTYLAGRFAIKEAVFKAVAPRTPAGFDLRDVTSYDRASGEPVFEGTKELQALLHDVGVAEVLLSLTHEADMAIAMALAQGFDTH